MKGRGNESCSTCRAGGGGYLGSGGNGHSAVVRRPCGYKAATDLQPAGAYIPKSAYAYRSLIPSTTSRLLCADRPVAIGDCRHHNSRRAPGVRRAEREAAVTAEHRLMRRWGLRGTTWPLVLSR